MKLLRRLAEDIGWKNLLLGQIRTEYQHVSRGGTPGAQKDRVELEQLRPKQEWTLRQYDVDIWSTETLVADVSFFLRNQRTGAVVVDAFEEMGGGRKLIESVHIQPNSKHTLSLTNVSIPVTIIPDASLYLKGWVAKIHA